MNLQQISVEVGKELIDLIELLDKFKSNKIYLLSFVLINYGNNLVFRFVPDNIENTKNFLKEIGYSFKEKSVMAIKLSQDPSDLSRLMNLITEKNLDIKYSYSVAGGGKKILLAMTPSESSDLTNSLKDEYQIHTATDFLLGKIVDSTLSREVKSDVSIYEISDFSLKYPDRIRSITRVLLEMQRQSIAVEGFSLFFKEGSNLNMVTSDSTQVEELFWNLGLRHRITEGLAIEMPNDLSFLLKICKSLENNKLRLDNIYNLTPKDSERLLIIKFSNQMIAAEILRKEKITILEPEEFIAMNYPATEEAGKKPKKPRQIEMEKKAERLGVAYVDLSEIQIDPEVAKLIPENIARRYRLICINANENECKLAMADPVDIFAIDEVRMALGRDIIPVLAAAEDISETIESIYGWKKTVLKDMNISDVTVLQEKKTTTEYIVVDQPIVAAVNKIIASAIEKKASDIHLEPFEDELLIRYRLDGVLQPVMSLPKNIAPSLVCRIKIMSNLKIDDTRSPQDGRIHLSLKGRELDVRVSVLPHMEGESVVLRLMDRSRMRMQLEDLGFTGNDLEKFKNIIKKPHGIILVTGPTGCGKSTTLYATLHVLNKPEVKIVTVEDPVEYKIKGTTQVQTNMRVGLTFASALRSFLRHDPDIIMVGEIRDKETASIAIEAALTGHLVLATLHTNNAVASIIRLVDMGIEPFLIASTLLGVAAQRLGRVICSQCKEPAIMFPELKEVFSKYGYTDENLKLYRGRGCRFCGNTGYRGRIGIFEMLEITEPIQELIIARASTMDIMKQAQKEGLRLLFEDGLAKVAQGITTYEEICRITAD